MYSTTAPSSSTGSTGFSTRATTPSPTGPTSCPFGERFGRRLPAVVLRGVIVVVGITALLAFLLD